MKKTNLMRSARFNSEPVFHWMDLDSRLKRAVLCLDAGQNLARQCSGAPTSLLLVEGRAIVDTEDGSTIIARGEVVDIPAYVDHAITARERTVIWLHRYED